MQTLWSLPASRVLLALIAFAGCSAAALIEKRRLLAAVFLFGAVLLAYILWQSLSAPRP